jgi:hypothetical protein
MIPESAGDFAALRGNFGWMRDVENIMYDQVQMRRFVSIVFLLLCCLGPLSALLPGSAESQLPACCRRLGAHHCAMATASEQGSGSGHVVTAPAHCPQYRHGSAATAGVFTPSTGLGIAQSLESRAVTAGIQTVTLHRARTSSDRGPPAIL